MKTNSNAFFIRLSAVALAAAGILYVLYPSIRPFSDESSLSGAAAFASSEWIVSHTMAIGAFVLLTIGLLGLYVSLRETNVENLVLYSLFLSLLGTGLTLPFYGAEVFGLHVIGQEAINQDRIELMSLANVVRFGPGFSLILAGLVILAAGSVTTAVAIWKSRIIPQWCGIPFALGFLLYLPQYMATQPLRIAHGAMLAVGCLWIAAGMWRHSRYK